MDREGEILSTEEFVAMEARIEELEVGAERLKRRVEHLELEYLGAAGSSSPEIDQPGSIPTLMDKDELMEMLGDGEIEVWLEESGQIMLIPAEARTVN